MEYNSLVLVKDRGDTGLFNAFICCTPLHPFIKFCIDELCSRINNFDYGLSPLKFSGPGFLYEKLLKYCKKKKKQ